jgi:hypothetical protein
VDPECGNGVGAEAAGSGVWSRGATPVNQPLSLGVSLNQEFTVQASVYGKVCLRHGRMLHRAPARHTYFLLPLFDGRFCDLVLVS